jgi:hypothetical protein
MSQSRKKRVSTDLPVGGQVVIIVFVFVVTTIV